jgi:hypothetical protein
MVIVEEPAIVVAVAQRSLNIGEIHACSIVNESTDEGMFSPQRPRGHRESKAKSGHGFHSEGLGYTYKPGHNNPGTALTARYVGTRSRK